MTYNGLRINIATSDTDRTFPLRSGKVAIEGVTPNFIKISREEMYSRMMNDEFDVSEMSLALYSLLRAKGLDNFVGIPVFLSRMFVHSYIYVHSDSNINEASDLIGKKVGVSNYQDIESVWVRSILKQEYNVQEEDIHWYIKEQHPNIEKVVPFECYKSLYFEVVENQGLLEQMLEDGKIDVLISRNVPSNFKGDKGKIKRLFENYFEEEKMFYGETDMFPILDIVVIRKELLQTNPWLAQSLYKAFNQAKKHAYHWITQNTALTTTSPWIVADMEEIQEVLKEDFWPYGVDKNKQVLEYTLKVMTEQGLIREDMTIDYLFPLSLQEND
jgi:4,5-dihydroxyphthalate decarboxylase